MKILFATYWSFPNTGAIDIYIRQAITALREAGHQVNVLSRGKWHQMRLHARKQRRLKLKGLYTQIHRGLRRSFRSLPQTSSDWITQREYEQYVYELGALELCRSMPYDIIHAHDVHAARAMMRVAPNVPTVVTTHGLLAYEWLAERRIEPGDSDEWRYTYLREKFGVLSPTLAITPSEWMRHEYIDYFQIPADQIVTIPYGFSVDSFEARRRVRPNGLPDLADSIVITCVARLVPLKGHQYLLQAVRLVKEAGYNVKCLLVGNGPAEKELRNLAGALGLDDTVVFLGRRDDVPGILETTDIFALASTQEITPLAISEAQLAGKPVVASAVGGVPDLIEHEVTGLLVPAGDYKALAKALIRLCQDQSLANMIGDAGRQVVLSDRTWEKHFTKILATYRQLVGS